jgi:hypothetical protein
MNQFLEGYLHLYCNYQQNNWSNFLPIAEFTYNNATHSATQVSPFFTNYGYNPHATLSIDVHFKTLMLTTSPVLSQNSTIIVRNKLELLNISTKAQPTVTGYRFQTLLFQVCKYD